MKRLLPQQVDEAAFLLRKGELVAFPTETVYGLGADIFQEEAVRKIFIAKGRPSDNPLIAHVSSFSQIERIARQIPHSFIRLYEHFFPGPLTVVLKKRECVPQIVSGGGDTVAFRMPAHPLALSLIEKVENPVVAPSANLSGTPSSTCVEHVASDFEGKIAAALDGGPCSIGIESTVISLIDNPVLLRPGSITKDQIERVLKEEIGLAKAGSEKPLSPGMKYRHYAPKAQVILVEEGQLEKHLKKGKKQHIFLPTCQNLYAQLRMADHKECSEVIVICSQEVLLNSALMNRLFKAAEKK